MAKDNKNKNTDAVKPDSIKKQPAPNIEQNSAPNYTAYVILAVGLIIAFLIGGLFEKQTRQVTSSSNETQANTELNPSQQQLDPRPDQIAEVKSFKNEPPTLQARAYGVYYPTNGEYKKLHSVESDTLLPPASVTKIMTAIIALEQYDLDKPVVIPAKCTGINGSSVGFRANQVFTLEDLLYGLLVRSGADAACAIANITNEGDFIQMMNAKAAELEMNDTSFANEIGFDASTAHLTTVNDIQRLTEAALRFSTFRKIVGTREISIQSLNSPASTYSIRNTNDLLFTIPGTIGIKTGYTEAARECLTFLHENRGQEILIVILGSEDRFGDTSKLLEWARAELED